MEPGKKGQVQGEAGWGTPGRTLTFLLVLLCLGKKKGWECVSGATSGPACEGVGPKEPAGARGRGHNTGFRGASETPEASALWGRAASRGRGAQSSGGQATPTTRSAGWGLAGSGFRWDLRNEEASGTTLGEGGSLTEGALHGRPPNGAELGLPARDPQESRTVLCGTRASPKGPRGEKGRLPHLPSAWSLWGEREGRGAFTQLVGASHKPSHGPGVPGRRGPLRWLLTLPRQTWWRAFPAGGGGDQEQS